MAQGAVEDRMKLALVFSCGWGFEVAVAYEYSSRLNADHAE